MIGSKFRNILETMNMGPLNILDVPNSVEVFPHFGIVMEKYSIASP
jgi:hypothetical protein